MEQAGGNSVAAGADLKSLWVAVGKKDASIFSRWDLSGGMFFGHLSERHTEPAVCRKEIFHSKDRLILLYKSSKV
jgi:hypothetical protein